LRGYPMPLFRVDCQPAVVRSRQPPRVPRHETDPAAEATPRPAVDAREVLIAIVATPSPPRRLGLVAVDIVGCHSTRRLAIYLGPGGTTFATAVSRARCQSRVSVGRVDGRKEWWGSGPTLTT